jgi:hypothetical protein
MEEKMLFTFERTSMLATHLQVLLILITAAKSESKFFALPEF